MKNIPFGPFGAADLRIRIEQEKKEREISVNFCSSIKFLRENPLTPIPNVRKFYLCFAISKKTDSPDHHHHKHQGLDPLIRSVSRVIVALSKVFLGHPNDLLPCGL